jgi:hypothetical protein
MKIFFGYQNPASTEFSSSNRATPAKYFCFSEQLGATVSNGDRN